MLLVEAEALPGRPTLGSPREMEYSTGGLIGFEPGAQGPQKLSYRCSMHLLRRKRQPSRPLKFSRAERSPRRLTQTPSSGREQHQRLEIRAAAGAHAGSPETCLANGTSIRDAHLSAGLRRRTAIP